MKDSFLTVSCGFLTGRNHKFFDILDIKTQQLQSAGIIDNFIRNIIEMVNPKGYKKPDAYTKEYLRDVFPKSFPRGPKVLKMETLEAGFVVWLVSLTLAVTAFILEWINRQTMFLVAKNILAAFYEQRILQSKPRKIIAKHCEDANVVVIEIRAYLVEASTSQDDDQISLIESSLILPEESTDRQETLIETPSISVEESPSQCVDQLDLKKKNHQCELSHQDASDLIEECFNAILENSFSKEEV